MTSAPIHAPVDCSDGQCGESEKLIVNPLTHKVTHLVVRDRDKKDSPPRLVPVEQVARIEQGRVRLRCTGAELAELEPFTEQKFRLATHADYRMAPIDPTGMLIGPVPVESYYVTDEVERVPEGELAVGTGTKVRTGDDEVGHIVELIGDPATREVTHIVVEHDGRDITLPLLAIWYVAEDVVHLKLNKTDLEMLPSIPARPQRGAWKGTDIEMIGVAFEELYGARDAMDFVTDLHRRGTLKIRNAVVLVHRADGKLVVDERGDLDAGQGALAGAVLGGVIGLLTGGAGLVVASLAGAALGGVGAKMVDRGFSNTFLKTLAERLRPGTSGLLLIVQHDWVTPLREAFADRKGVILQQELTDHVIAELTGEPAGSPEKI